MSIEDKIIAARPDAIVPNSEFTDAVMEKIVENTRQTPILSRIVHRASVHPFFALLVILFTVGLLSGTIYAISVLWPIAGVLVTDEGRSKSGRDAVGIISESCPHEIANGLYELKRNATITKGQTAAVVKAECESLEILAWFEKTYPQRPTDTSYEYSPNTTSDEKYTGLEGPATIAAIDDKAILFKGTQLIDGSSSEELAITASTKFIVNRQVATARDVKAGDAVQYVVRRDRQIKVSGTGDVCYVNVCSVSVLSSDDTLLAVVKLSQQIDLYNKFGSLTRLDECMGNPQDLCTDTPRMDVLNPYAYSDSPSASTLTPPTQNTDNQYPADLEGVLISHNASEFVIQTTSGRKARVTTEYDVIERFNNAQNEVTVQDGDRLSLNYMRASEHAQETVIDQQENFLHIYVILEMPGKGDPINKY